ncbi:MAG TPA: hypothetical protein PLB10_17865 [Thiolinea sp.]|nr:hypothetical protein [Thiolinea sp.]
MIDKRTRAYKLSARIGQAVTRARIESGEELDTELATAIFNRDFRKISPRKLLEMLDMADSLYPPEALRRKE